MLETNFRFHEEWRTVGKIQFLLFNNSVFALRKYLFSEKVRALKAIIPGSFGIFLKFPKIPPEVGNCWGNLYVAFLLVITTVRFAFGELKIWLDIKNSQNIMKMIGLTSIPFFTPSRHYSCTHVLTIKAQ